MTYHESHPIHTGRVSATPMPLSSGYSVRITHIDDNTSMLLPWVVTPSELTSIIADELTRDLDDALMRGLARWTL